MLFAFLFLNFHLSRLGLVKKWKGPDQKDTQDTQVFDCVSLLAWHNLSNEFASLQQKHNKGVSPHTKLKSCWASFTGTCVSIKPSLFLMSWHTYKPNRAAFLHKGILHCSPSPMVVQSNRPIRRWGTKPLYSFEM